MALTSNARSARYFNLAANVDAKLSLDPGIYSEAVATAIGATLTTTATTILPTDKKYLLKSNKVSNVAIKVVRGTVPNQKSRIIKILVLDSLRSALGTALATKTFELGTILSSAIWTFEGFV
jgi:hypothetical protein